MQGWAHRADAAVQLAGGQLGNPWEQRAALLQPRHVLCPETCSWLGTRGEGQL